METLAALAAQVQNLATRLHELEEKMDRVSGQTRIDREDKGIEDSPYAKSLLNFQLECSRIIDNQRRAF